ncbi:S-methyl-5'-thioadenosine phosphorylase [Micromonospora sp. DR5-3]|uniref:S-methyl-5'-thioadenosine phosphorylase n=1 Tax=unclassified Micromonospora TaxID=2617518 RepID=UPI0011DB9375|nr:MULTISPECIES: S-methyl-5'-thioadenosine phosphorylase [unclassified Micromonospora]MCW3819851.1 S-methyl-5'-thioadenosine phosphorylase [Micromonospora sp. DR5-3]TYC19921.1 S-methyl-5'-thioadenosine phosphorylase [Micromonospora sp. MP36]
MAGSTPVGVIGGSGLYSLLEEAEQVSVETPYGEPSDQLVRGMVGGREVIFLPRHGRGHKHPAHVINYRANLWALRSLGVRQVLGPCAVGSLRAELGPGSFVVPDQVVDRTSGRAATFFDTGAVHVGFADPYCPHGRAAVLKNAADLGQPIVDGGTMVVINGPRFSTRAESQYYARQGWSLINMTGLPEAALARELAMCYTSIALVTDLDAGVDEESAVAQDEVFRVFAENIERLRELVLRTVAGLGDQRDCRCVHAHDGLTLPFSLPG